MLCAVLVFCAASCSAAFNVAATLVRLSDGTMGDGGMSTGGVVCVSDPPSSSTVDGTLTAPGYSTVRASTGDSSSQPRDAVDETFSCRLDGFSLFLSLHGSDVAAPVLPGAALTASDARGSTTASAATSGG